MKSDGSYGEPFPIKPSKVTDEWLDKHSGQYEWFEREENVAEQSLVGPFNFNADNTIPKEVWDELKLQAAKLNLDVRSAFRKRN